MSGSLPSAPEVGDDVETAFSSTTQEVQEENVAGPRMVSVVAPANLREGYTFEASLNGELFDVTVPEGGVIKDQVFLAPFLRKPLDATLAPMPVPVEIADPIAEPLAEATYSEAVFSPAITPTRIMVSVMAPKTMAGGQTFKASFNGQIFDVTVPTAGVTQGQMISVPLPTESSAEEVGSSDSAPVEPPTMVSVLAPSKMRGGQSFKASFNGQMFDVTVPAAGVVEGQLLSVPLPTSRSEPPPQSEPIMVSVIAPANLLSGDVFKASFNGELFDVTVPSGGVTQGQIISAPFVNKSRNTASSISSTIPVAQKSITVGLAPHGQWRNDICGCCDYGCCNPVMCWAWWFSPVALGQVMTRMKLNPGADVSSYGYENTCGIVVGIMIGAWVVFAFLAGFLGWFAWLIYLAGSIYFIVIGTKTRIAVRKKYDIEGSGFEDCCCFYWCTCCAITQMASHTHDPKMYKPQCCTYDGLPPDAPEIV
jgi:Cys-rich protein (TIGR01571 family)